GAGVWAQSGAAHAIAPAVPSSQICPRAVMPPSTKFDSAPDSLISGCGGEVFGRSLASFGGVLPSHPHVPLRSFLQLQRLPDPLEIVIRANAAVACPNQQETVAMVDEGQFARL